MIKNLVKTLIPKREKSANKGTFGTLTVVGGSEKCRGASILACEAALRSGVGICRLCSTEKVISAAVSRRPEIIFQPIEENINGAMSADSFVSKMKHIAKSSSVLVGIGMTDCFDTEEVVSAVLSNYESTLIIDADGLNSIKTCPEKLLNAKKIPIITPHVGEMSRLTKMSISEIKENRERVALDFSKKFNCVTVLKDSITVIASPEGKCMTLDRENSGLAKGGSGDVLSGIIASLSAQGLAPYDAALCGAIIHSEAGLAASSIMAEESVLPSDVITCLSAVFKELRS
ncbi:MAG: NAD(P)H-hydrate dehydratase [Clostridia bacterium]|nr:NAD(P)H-hydrate dehydratase [Clostridia bacterium]